MTDARSAGGGEGASPGLERGAPRLTLRAPGAWVPLAMSGAALALLVVHLVVFEPVRRPDEGAAARAFQLLLAGQLPVIAWFALTWVSRDPRRVTAIVGLQAAAIAVALAAAWLVA